MQVLRFEGGHTGLLRATSTMPTRHSSTSALRTWSGRWSGSGPIPFAPRRATVSGREFYVTEMSVPAQSTVAAS